MKKILPRTTQNNTNEELHAGARRCRGAEKIKDGAISYGVVQSGKKDQMYRILQ